jgi:hypothetical protein
VARHYFTSESSSLARRGDLPSLDFLSVVGLGIAMFSAGILVTQIFPRAEASREYLLGIASGWETASSLASEVAKLLG